MDLPKHRVRIIGWRHGLLKISMIEIIKARFGYGLIRAKDCTDNVLDGVEVVLECYDETNAREAAQELQEIGAEVSIELWSNCSRENA